jgi:L-malate glycosyltransferase
MVVGLLGSKAYLDQVEPTLIVLNEGLVATKARANGLNVVVVPESGKSFWSLAQEMGRVIRDRRPDIVHTHRYKEILLGAMLKGASRANHVVTIHGYEPPVRLLARVRAVVGNAICIGFAVIRGARFVVVAHHLRKYFRIPQARCITIHNGIAVLDETRPEAATGLASASVSVGPVIGWIGRMVPVKGLPTLLRALPQVQCAAPPTLLLLGDGPDRASLETLASSLGISDRVRFMGFVDNPRQFHAQMDVFALPSLHEGIPIALLEALGAGLPVVASAVGGIPRIVSDDTVGVLIDSDSPAVWASALTELLNDRNRMATLGTAARQHVEENFSMDRMAGDYVALYQSTIAS